MDCPPSPYRGYYNNSEDYYNLIKGIFAQYS
jgi:hypothetical protein